MDGAVRRLVEARRREERLALGEVERDAPVVRADRRDARPDDLAGREQLVEVIAAEAGNARGQHLHLEDGEWNRATFELRDRFEERGLDRRFGPALLRRGDRVPFAEEARERLRRHGLDRLAETRERLLLQRAEDLDVDVFGAASPRMRAGSGKNAPRASFPR